MQKVDKIPVFNWFYDQGDVLVTVLIKGSDQNLLTLPPQFYKNDSETFIVGPSPTPNLTYDDEGVTAPMRFGGNFFKCFFPWKSIIMLAGNSAVIQFTTEKEDEKNVSPTAIEESNTSLEEKAKSTKKTHLKVIK